MYTNQAATKSNTRGAICCGRRRPRWGANPQQPQKQDGTSNKITPHCLPHALYNFQTSNEKHRQKCQAQPSIPCLHECCCHQLHSRFLVPGTLYLCVFSRCAESSTKFKKPRPNNHQCAIAVIRKCMHRCTVGTHCTVLHNVLHSTVYVTATQVLSGQHGLDTSE